MLGDNQRSIIVTEVNKLIGKPFRHASNSSLGMDCRGFVWLAYHRAGIHLPMNDGRMYTADWWRHTNEERLLNKFLDVFEKTTSPELGDILLFRLFRINGPINHCGILTGNDTFVHCYANKSTGGVYPQSLDYKWKRRTVYFLTYKG